jgi:hypothetical protein
VSTHYASPIVELTHPDYGVWQQSVVTASLFDDPERGWRAYVRRWLTPSNYGPPGTMTVSIVHGSGPATQIHSTYVTPPARQADFPAAIAAAVEAIKKEKAK